MNPFADTLGVLSRIGLLPDATPPQRQALHLSAQLLGSRLNHYTTIRHPLIAAPSRVQADRTARPSLSTRCPFATA